MPTTELPAWFADAMQSLNAGNVDGWMALYADDAVHEFPFAPDSRPARLEGKATIAAYMQQLPGRMEFESLTVHSVREAGDELIVEASATGKRLPGGEPFALDYVWFITREHGLVTRIRDYMNPLQLRSL